RNTVHQFHHEKIDAVDAVVVVDRRDVRMVESRQRKGLLAKTFARCRICALRCRQNLERDVAVKPRVVSFVHFPHPTCAEMLVDSVVAESLTDHVISGEQLSYTRSTIIESPMPPEMHSVASPTGLVVGAERV